MIESLAAAFRWFVHDSGAFWFWPLTALAAAVAAKGFFVGLARWRLARRLEDLPTSRVRSAAQGLTELLGRVECLPGRELLAPLTKQRSVWWSYRIQMVRGAAIDDWRFYLATVFFQKLLDLFDSFPVQESAASEQPFLLRDETGSCVVFPKDSEVVFGHREIWYGDERYPGGLRFTGWSLSSDYRYEEQRVEVGDLVYVIGHFRSDETREYSWEEDMEVEELLLQWQRNHDGLLARHDGNRDGVIDPAEWALVRRAARREIRRRRIGRLLGVTPHRILNGRDGHGLLIVVLSEPQLEFRLRCAGAGWLLLFFGLSAVSMMSVYMRLGI